MLERGSVEKGKEGTNAFRNTQNEKGKWFGLIIGGKIILTTSIEGAMDEIRRRRIEGRKY